MKGMALPAGSVAVVGSAQHQSCAHPVSIFRRILRWIGTAIWESRQRQTERDIALVVGGSVDHLSDELERRVQEHIMRNRNFRVRD
jgi:hypothetical protein